MTAASPRPGFSRREFLAGSAALGAGLAGARGQAREGTRALIAVSLDLEMSRGFPRPEDDHWDFEKGNLDADTKRYAVEAARLVKERGGRIHFFAVGRVFEQEEVGWLEEIVEAGHPVGNHTYDHVNLSGRLRKYGGIRAPLHPQPLRCAPSTIGSARSPHSRALRLRRIDALGASPYLRNRPQRPPVSRTSSPASGGRPG